MQDYSQFRHEARRLIPNPDDYRFSVALPNKNDLKEYAHEGQRYIEGRKGTEYILRFVNLTHKTVEAIFSVDGLSVIDGKTAGVGSTGYVVRPYQTIEVPGWRIDSGKVAKFVFRPQGDRNDMTYVEALRSEGVNVDASNQGVIGCLVFAEKEVHRDYYNKTLSAQTLQSRPRGFSGATGQSLRGSSVEDYYFGNVPTMDSYNASSERGIPCSASLGQNSFTKSISQESEKVGTGFGEDHAFKTVNVQFTRADNYNPTKQFVIHYDTLAGLRRRGVPVDEVKAPNAFPASPHLNSDGCRIPRKR